MLVFAATVVVAQSCLAALKVGDAAPKMQVGKWLQGDAVTEFAGDKVYIIEFWATWCGPCKASIPHLNDLHERFKDKGLVVIGQNVMENDDSLVEPFVKSMAGKMNYRVAADDKSAGGGGYMAKAWLAAAEQKGIPCAFVVNKEGRIASIGHPMSLKEEELEKWLALPAAEATTAGPGRSNTAAGPSPKAQELARRAKAEIRAGELDKAEATIAELQDSLTEKSGDIGGLLSLDLLLARKQSDDALQLAKLLGEDFKGNPAVQNAVAWHLARQPDANASLLTAAEKIATPISKLGGDQQATAVATLARIAFARSDKTRAVEIQSKAVAIAPQTEAPLQQAVLDAYKQGRLPADEKP